MTNSISVFLPFIFSLIAWVATITLFVTFRRMRRLCSEMLVSAAEKVEIIARLALVAVEADKIRTAWRQGLPVDEATMSALHERLEQLKLTRGEVPAE